jgi:hypothetical protein
MKSNKDAEYFAAAQEAFNVAADKSTGAARPVFERLRDSHAAMTAVPVSRRIGQAFHAVSERYAQAYDDVEVLAQKDKAAAKVWAEAAKKIHKATVKFQESP